MEKQEKQKGDQYLTPKELAQLLKVNLKTIYNYTQRGILKRYSFGGRRVYYLRSEIETAMFGID